MPHRMPHTVHLTRFGRGAMDSDNLIFAFKGIRDEIARHCGFDDRNPLVHWVYGQGYGRHHEVEVNLSWRPE